MNRREMMGTTLAMLGDPANENNLHGEILRYLNFAGSNLAGALFNVEKELFLTEDTIPAVNGTRDYDGPADLRDYARITYAGMEVRRISYSKLSMLEENPIARPVRAQGRMNYCVIGSTTPGRSKERYFPTPNDTSNIVRGYFRRHKEFHDAGSAVGLATGGSNATIVDALLPFNTTGSAYLSFWVNAEVRFTSGPNTGIKARITTQVVATSTLTFSPLTPTAVANGDTYEIDEVSIIPEQHHPMMCFYAAALAAPKVGKDAAGFMAVWDREMAEIEKKWTRNLDANIPGQDMQGIAAART